MILVELAVIILITSFFIGAIYMLCTFYTCDSENCKAYKLAEKKGKKGTKEYTLALLEEMYNDGIWPLPLIGAVFISAIVPWLLKVQLTVKTFSIVFILSFLVIYFIFAFFGHHYIRPLKDTISSYILEDDIVD